MIDLTTDGPAKFQYVPVPEHLVTAVIRFIADQTGDSSPAQLVSDEAEVEVSDDHGWSDADLRRLVEAHGRVYDLTRDIYDYLADRPDEWAGTSEIVEGIDWGLGSVRNFPTQMKRSFRAHFDGRGGIFESAWGPRMDPPRDGQLYYRFTADTADRWRRARSE